MRLPIEIVVATLSKHADRDRDYDLARQIIEDLEAEGWELDAMHRNDGEDGRLEPCEPLSLASAPFSDGALVTGSGGGISAARKCLGGNACWGRYHEPACPVSTAQHDGTEEGT